MEDDADDTVLISKEKKKEKKGTVMRAKIQGIRDKHGGTSSGTSTESQSHETSLKRKVSTTSAECVVLNFSFFSLLSDSLFLRPRKSKKAKGPVAPTGVFKNWDARANDIPPVRSQSGASSSPLPSGVTPEDDDSDPFKQGGIPSGDDEIEHVSIAKAGKSYRFKVCGLINFEFVLC